MTAAKPLPPKGMVYIAESVTYLSPELLRRKEKIAASSLPISIVRFKEGEEDKQIMINEKMREALAIDTSNVVPEDINELWNENTLTELKITLLDNYKKGIVTTHLVYQAYLKKGIKANFDSEFEIFTCPEDEGGWYRQTTFFNNPYLLINVDKDPSTLGLWEQNQQLWIAGRENE